MIILMTSYTFLCFSIFGYQDPDKKKSLLRQQNVLMFMIHIISYLVMYLEQEDVQLLAFYLMQVVLFGATILLYTIIYPRVSRLVVNNMCMLLCIGMIMLTRLSYSNAVKQFVIAAGIHRRSSWRRRSENCRRYGIHSYELKLLFQSKEGVSHAHPLLYI